MAVQGLGALAVLPLVLRHFAEPETAFWLLLLTLSALQVVFRFGAWLAWAIVQVSTSLQVSGAHFEALLQGMNHVAVAARWQALFGLASLLSMLAVLLLHPNLLLLVLVHQAWLIAGIWRTRMLCHHVLAAGRRGLFTRGWDRAVFAIAWPAAWRSGIGHLASTGTTQLLGVLHAQAASAASSASFLLGLRLLTMLEQFANAPFYSRIPRLNALSGSGQVQELNRMAARGMRFTYWTFLTGLAVLTWVGPAALGFVDSKVAFPGFPLWHVLAIAFFVQRFGGTHIQLHSTTNRIVWHWANGAGGVVTVALVATLLPLAGLDAIAFAMLAGNIVYAAIAARFSYGSLGEPAWRFELADHAGHTAWAARDPP